MIRTIARALPAAALVALWAGGAGLDAGISCGSGTVGGTANKNAMKPMRAPRKA